jgi:type II secretory pathway pseudopilin PulG
MKRGMRALTLIEVMIAMFIFMVGIVGVLAALPTGVNAANYVILQDAAIHLAQSKFAEFRRDRVDPAVDLAEGSAYLATRQAPLATLPNGGSHPDNSAADIGTRGKWRDFAYRNADDPYRYFDDIDRYEWRVLQDELKIVSSDTTGSPAPSLGYKAPVDGGTDIGLRLVRIAVRLKGTPREFLFVQYMAPAGRVAPVDVP